MEEPVGPRWDRVRWIDDELERMQARKYQLESIRCQLCNEMPLETLEKLYSPTFALGILTEKPECMLLPRPQLSTGEESPSAAWNEEVQQLVREERMLEEEQGVLHGLSLLKSRDDLLAFYGSTEKVDDLDPLYVVLRRRKEAVDKRLRAFRKFQIRVRYDGAGKLPLRRLRRLTITEANDALRLAYSTVRSELRRQAKKKGHVNWSTIGRDHHEKLRDQFLAVLGQPAYRYRALHKDRILLCGWRKCKRSPVGV